MTQVQTIGGLKRGRGRGRGRGAGRGRTARGEKPDAFQPFKGSGFSLSTADSGQTQQQHHSTAGSGVFAAEQHHTGVSRLQQQHEEALQLRAVQLAELQKQAEASSNASGQAETSMSGNNTSDPLGATSAVGSTVIDLCDDDDTQPAKRPSNSARPPAKPREKVNWSLGVDRAVTGATASSSSNTGDNPFWCPARYVPVGGEKQADLRLQTHEVAQVFDSGLVGHRAAAILDTGNAGCTLITRSFARQLGLVDMHGNPTQAYSRQIRVQGVVAGAFEMIKTLNIAYEIKGKKMHIVAGLTEARLGCDLLISRHDIIEFERDGYRLSAR